MTGEIGQQYIQYIVVYRDVLHRPNGTVLGISEIGNLKFPI